MAEELTQQNRIDKSHFEELARYISHNYQIAEYYGNLYEETAEERFETKSRAIDLCCKWWDTDYYRMQDVKDIKRVNLCRDKFCFNCQSMLAIKRQGKFSPVLDGLRKLYKVCHVVITVPNCEAEELLPLLDRMYKKFPLLMRYFKGAAKVRGVDFGQYGYGGAVRGLEVTQNKEDKTFHPHFHCMVLFRKDLDLSGKLINSYSYDEGLLVRQFCELEVLLQKVWYLLMNDIKVTERAIDELAEGYSVIVDDSGGNYHEAFKYACKGAFDEKKGAFIYNELTFRALQQALNSRRMIQGYGELYGFKDLDGELIEAEVIDEYARQIAELQSIEKPDFCAEPLEKVIEEAGRCRYISKSNLKRLIIERKRQEQNGGGGEE